MDYKPRSSTTSGQLRTEDDIVAIGNLCRIAGVDSSLYLTKKSASGQYLTVGQISHELTERRAAEAGRTEIMNHVDTVGSGARPTIEKLQAEANAFARSNGRTPAQALYVKGAMRKGTTPEQAFAAALEANPEVYEAYRDKHNAQALVAQLQKAGYKLQTAQ